MRLPPSHSSADPKAVETVPGSELATETATPLSDTWDSEAPTAVFTRRPLFMPPPLPHR